MQHNALAQRLHKQLSAQTGAKEVVTLRTNVSVPCAERPRSYVQRQRWFTVIDPDAELIARARAFASNLTCIPRVRAVLDGIT